MVVTLSCYEMSGDWVAIASYASFEAMTIVKTIGIPPIVSMARPNLFMGQTTNLFSRVAHRSIDGQEVNLA
jgi:hypothetical protein